MTSEHLITSTRTLPAGYTVRPSIMSDAQAKAELLRIVTTAQGHTETLDPADIVADWGDNDFNMETSTLTILDPNGRVVAMSEVWDTSPLPVHPYIDWLVLPEELESGVGDYLMDWAEKRAGEAIHRIPEDARFSLHAGTLTGYTPEEAFLERRGMERIRFFFRMLIAMEEAPPAPQWPEGISVRSMRGMEELDWVNTARVDAFRDHWGFIDIPIEESNRRMREFVENDPKHNPDLYFLAIDDATGEIAGVSLCRIENWGFPEDSYLHILGVRRAYRKRGLALALLHHSFGEFWRRGRPRVALHVDGSSLTGAVGVYERAGMHVDKSYTTYERIVRDGRELSTTSVES